MMIKPVTTETLDDVARLFATESVTRRCWCMWFIRPVKAFHAAGEAGNAAQFRQLLADSAYPLGLVAYHQDEPVGWCAAGPRTRYARAVKTPTYRAAMVEPDAPIWLVPCFFIRPDMRHMGVSRTLLEAAIERATHYGATALDGFPLSGPTRRAHGDTQVGFASVFRACGFNVIHTPSASRVIMRRDLNGSNSESGVRL